jgi:hypothetical protein
MTHTPPPSRGRPARQPTGRQRPPSRPGRPTDSTAHPAPTRPNPGRDHRTPGRDTSTEPPRDSRDTKSRETSREIDQSRPSRDQKHDNRTRNTIDAEHTHPEAATRVPAPRPPSEPKSPTKPRAAETTSDIPANTGADQAKWCYDQNNKRGPGRRYSGQIRRVSGPEGERLRAELAAVMKDLLQWAAETQENTTPGHVEADKPDGAKQGEGTRDE